MRSGVPSASGPALADARAANANAEAVDPSSSDGDQGPLSLPHVCWLFMGLGVYRAWIEVCFVGSFVSYPAPYGMRSLFDVACVAVLFALAVLARRVSPLSSKPAFGVCSAVLMTVAAALGFVALAWPQWAGVLSLPSSVIGGAGLAITILLWSELYGCLSPMRIATPTGSSRPPRWPASRPRTPRLPTI